TPPVAATPRTPNAVDISKPIPAKPAPIPVLPAPLGPDPVDDGTTRGAVAEPSAVVDDELGINFFDTTVTFAELPTLDARWQKRERVRYKGRVPIAIHRWRHAKLALSFVAPVDIRVSDYPGTLKTIELLDTETSPINNNAFNPLRWEPRGEDQGGSAGPIHAAIRVLPTRTSPESERRQVVVYVPPKSKVVLVASRLVGESTWTPLLRVDTPNATEIDLISPGWH
ncbi:MAG: hypothetical protein ACKV2T_39345, partial [Kofleriaceae bacterium]